MKITHHEQDLFKEGMWGVLKIIWTLIKCIILVEQRKNCKKCSLDISNFLEQISSFSHSIVFLYFVALITEEGFLISPYYSLELCIQMGISFIFSFAFSFSSFLSSLLGLLRQPLAFLHFFFLGWSWLLPPVQCQKPPSTVLQTLCLSNLIPWLYFS